MQPERKKPLSTKPNEMIDLSNDDPPALLALHKIHPCFKNATDKDLKALIRISCSNKLATRKRDTKGTWPFTVIWWEVSKLERGQNEKSASFYRSCVSK